MQFKKNDGARASSCQETTLHFKAEQILLEEEYRENERLILKLREDKISRKDLERLVMRASAAEFLMKRNKELGDKLFNWYCSLCHSYHGKEVPILVIGKGAVNTLYGCSPEPLHSENVDEERGNEHKKAQERKG